MKVTYLRLDNFAVIYVGQRRESIEIEFPESGNKIVSIQGVNGSAKSGLISNISPFAYPTNIDDRSTLSSIREGKNGYKEIHYRKNKDLYIIKHYYKASKSSHTVKSYFSKNGEELNDNGNVSSFLSLVEIHFGLTQDMMRLLRLGSNVNSFISLTPARRKEYIGSLIDEIDMYMKIYKKVNEDLRVLKVMMASNAQNLYNCHISDITVEKDALKEIKTHCNHLETDRDQIHHQMATIDALIQGNDIHELRRKKQEAESSLMEFEKTMSEVKARHLESATIDQLIRKRELLTDSRIEHQSKINSYRISMDRLSSEIEKKEIQIRRSNTDFDLSSLANNIDSIKSAIVQSQKILRGTVAPHISSMDLQAMIGELSSMNSIVQNIYAFGDKSLHIYLRLKREKEDVDRFVKEHLKRNLTKVNESDLRKLLSQLFQEDGIITPNCDHQFLACPYYTFAAAIQKARNVVMEESIDDETLRYIQITSNSIDRILNQSDQYRASQIPDHLKEMLVEESIIQRLTDHLVPFQLSLFHEFLSIVREYEILHEHQEKLKTYEQQLAAYRSSGTEHYVAEIKEHRDQISFYRNNIAVLEKEITSLTKEFEDINTQIALVSKYCDGKKYESMLRSTIASTEKILTPLESSEKERTALQYRLEDISRRLADSREHAKQVEYKISEYERLQKEEKILSKKYNDLSVILEAVSTKKGIPVLYMKQYLGKIQMLANKLLHIIYGDRLQLARFKVTQETFEIPYIRNGVRIPDVKFASQSEVPLCTMALSFALSYRATEKYNIILLDEMDAGFDEQNRSAFLKMLHQQMETLNAEQVFIISHNINNITDVPIDVIRMSEMDTDSSLQNVIYG